MLLPQITPFPILCVAFTPVRDKDFEFGKESTVASRSLRMTKHLEKGRGQDQMTHIKFWS